MIDASRAEDYGKLIQVLDRLGMLLDNPVVPPGFQWWTTKDIAKAFGYAEAVARDSIVKTPGFPRPCRIGKGQPRWKATEVTRWMEKQRA